ENDRQAADEGGTVHDVFHHRAVDSLDGAVDLLLVQAAILHLGDHLFVLLLLDGGGDIDGHDQRKQQHEHGGGDPARIFTHSRKTLARGRKDIDNALQQTHVALTGGGDARSGILLHGEASNVM